MEISVVSRGTDVKPEQVAQIERDLEKIDRRLKDAGTVSARVRISNGQPLAYDVLVEIDYRRNHLRAKAVNADVGVAVREAREEILRQIKDRSQGGHSSYTKH